VASANGEVLGIQKDNAALIASAKYLARNGNRDGAIAEMRKMNMNPEQLEEKIQRVLEAGEYEGALEVVRAIEGPEEARFFLEDLDKKEDDKYLSYPDMTMDDRRSVRRAAEQVLVQSQTAFYNELVLGIETGTPAKPAQIQEWKEMGRLSAGQATAYLNAYHSSQKKFDPSSHAALRREIAAYDPSSDRDGETYSNILGSILGQPEKVVTDLKKALNDKIGGSEDTTTRRRVSDRLNDLYRKNFFSGGIEPNPEDEAEMRDVSLKYLRIQEKADELTRLYPDAKSSEIMDMLFEEGGEAEPLVTHHAAQLIRDARTPVVGGRDTSDAVRGAYFRALQRQYPGLSPEMTFQDAIKAVGSEGLTPEELQRLRRYYGNQR
jgi:Arc/MetJ-type ribon-helix-helix transcriptional regulator